MIWRGGRGKSSTVLVEQHEAVYARGLSESTTASYLTPARQRIPPIGRVGLLVFRLPASSAGHVRAFAIYESMMPSLCSRGNALYQAFEGGAQEIEPGVRSVAFLLARGAQPTAYSVKLLPFGAERSLYS
jgi:hypothetical protein